MRTKSAEQQSIEYLKKKQEEVIDDMAQWQMYRFAIDALEEKEKRNKTNEQVPIAIIDEMHKLKDKIRGMSMEEVERTLKQLSKEELSILLRAYIYDC